MIRFIFWVALSISAIHSVAQPKAKKTVFIIADGIPADVIEKLELPNFRKIAAAGGFARTLVGGEKGTYTETPTISAVGYNSVLTGTWVNKHNVWDNDIAAPNYSYPTIFRLLKTQHPEKKIGIFSSWQDNRTKLTGDGLAATGSFTFDYKFDGLELDTVNYPHDAKRQFMHRIDEKVTDEAARTIRQHGPDLSWVYLEYTDDMGHMYGDGPEFYKAIAYTDAQLGRIWEAIEFRRQNFNEDWLFIVTTDHGRDSATGKHHGGQSPREKAGWILTNATDLTERFRNNESAMTDIMPTIARFMDIGIPVDIRREIDGIPIYGRLSASGLTAKQENNRVHLQWKALQRKGKVKIWGVQTNHFKAGGQDNYQLLKTVRLKKQKAVIEQQPSDFYKIVLEAKHNTLNRWIVNATNTK